MNPDISVIIPIFNAETHLKECLTSIAKHDFQGHIEVLLINDYSSDGSRDLCIQFTKSHPELFRYYEQPKNLGVSAARNRGIELSKGSFFCFVDADDILPTNALQALHTAAQKFNADIVKGNNVLFNHQKCIPAPYNVSQQELLKGDLLLTHLLSHKKLRGHSWGKLFRATTLRHIRFPEGARMAEDLAYCTEAFTQSTTLVLIPEIIYQYRLNPLGAAQNKYKNLSYRDWLNTLSQIEKKISTREQMKAYDSLVIRSMLQFARECRSFRGPELKRLMHELNCFAEDRGIKMARFAANGILFRSLFHYFKYKLTIYRLNQWTSTKDATNSSH